MTEIHTAQYVDLGDLLTKDQLDVWNADYLPWTYGDTHLTCITKEDLLGWLQEGLDHLDDPDKWKDTVEIVTALPKDVLISL